MTITLLMVGSEWHGCRGKAEHLTQRCTGQFGDAILAGARRRVMLRQRIVDELADAHHAHTAVGIAHEDVLFGVNAHDDHTVIAQLIDVEFFRRCRSRAR